MIRLDCESRDSTETTIAELFGVSRNNVCEIISSIQIPDRLRQPQSEFILKQFKGKTKKEPANGSTCWFHISRTRSPASFSDGIKPLDQILPSIKQHLSELGSNLVKEEDLHSFWKELEETNKFGHFHRLYRNKSSRSLHFGPYAILLKETAFNANAVGNHDYLKIPEIVEDIATCFLNKFKIDLKNAYLRETTPVIVKFVVDEIQVAWIESALEYLHSISTGNKFPSRANTCIDLKNNLVPPNRIVSIESVPENQ